MIEDRLLEFRDAIKRKEQLQREAVRQADATSYRNAMNTLIENVSKSPIFEEAGFDFEHWRWVVHSDVEVDRTASIQIYGDALIHGYNVRTSIKWGDSIAPGSGAPYVVTVVSPENRAAVDDFFVKIAELEERERRAAEQERLSVEKMKPLLVMAEEFIRVARAYKGYLADYEKEVAEWVATEHARLWKPWNVYDIKVWPYASSSATMPVEPDEMTVLESPEEIVMALSTSISRSFTTKVREVSARGQIQVITICGLYYGKVHEITEPGWQYHRCYRSNSPHDFDPCVYVPAFETREPSPAPEWIGFWRDVCDRLVAHAPVGDDEKARQQWANLAQIASQRGCDAIAALEKPEDFF